MPFDSAIDKADLEERALIRRVSEEDAAAAFSLFELYAVACLLYVHVCVEASCSRTCNVRALESGDAPTVPFIQFTVEFTLTQLKPGANIHHSLSSALLLAAQNSNSVFLNYSAAEQELGERTFHT